jgi:integrase
MPRPRKDGTPPRPAHKRNLTDLLVRRVKPEEYPYVIWDTTQKGLGLAVRPTGSRSYKFVYSHHRRVRWYTIGDARGVGLREARQFARELWAEVIRGKDPASEKQNVQRSGTFGELARRYIEEHAKKKLKSWEQSQYKIERHLFPRFEHRQVASISSKDLRALHRKISAAGSPIAANMAVLAAGAVFKWAMKEEIVDLDNNPARNIGLNAAVERDRFLTDEEIRAVWPELLIAGRAGDALRTILVSGQRPGEIVGMKWSQIEGNWFEIPASGYKTKKPHRVYLSAAAFEALGPRDENGGRVFETTKAAMQQAARRIAAKLKMPAWHPHDLRATCATGLSSLGVMKETISRILGHVEGGTTARYIRHEYDAQKAEALGRWARHVEAVVRGEAPPKVVPMRQNR